MEEVTKSEEIKNEIILTDFEENDQGELIRMKDYDKTKKDLLVLAKKYKDFKVTKENIKEAKLVLKELRTPRYDIQNLEKNNIGFLNKAKTFMKDKFSDLKKVISPIEDRVSEEIKEIENEKKIEKARQEKVEQERIVRINKEISDYRVEFLKLLDFGRTDEDIKKAVSINEELEEKIEKDYFEEFTFDVENLLEDMMPKFDELRSRVKLILEDEERSKKVAIERVRMDRINKLISKGFEINDEGIYEYKTMEVPEEKLNSDNLVFNEFISPILDKIEEDKKLIKKEAENKKKAEAKKKKEEEDKLKAEREKFEKEREEFEEQKRVVRRDNRVVKLMSIGYCSCEPFDPNDLVLDNIDSLNYSDFVDLSEDEFSKFVDVRLQKITEYKKSIRAKIKAEQKTYDDLVSKAVLLEIDMKNLDSKSERIVLIEELQNLVKSKEDEDLKEKVRISKLAGVEHHNKISDIFSNLENYISEVEVFEEHLNPMAELIEGIKDCIKKFESKVC